METEFALSLGTERWALPADRDTITIGRASNADVRLQADDQISRIHARLARAGVTWTLIDESRNGTALNGRRISAPTPLSNNDRIHIGRSVLTFHEPAPVGGAAPVTPEPTHDPADAPAAPPPAQPDPSRPSAQPEPSAPPEAFGAPLPPPAVQPGAAGNLPHPEPGPPGTPPPSDAGAPAWDDPAQPQWADAGSSPGPQRPTASEHAGPAHPEPVDPMPAHPQQVNAPPAHPDGMGERNRPGVAPMDRADLAPVDQRDLPPMDRPAPAPVDRHDLERTDRRDLAPVDRMDTGRDPAQSQFATGGPATDSELADRASGAGAASADGEPGVDSVWADADGAGPELSRSAEAWAAYPSADNPEPARSPWANAVNRPLPSDRPVGGSASSGWPGAGDRLAPEIKPTASAKSGPTDARREPADSFGQVRLARVLTISGAALGLGLLINLAGTFLASGPGGALRWLVAPTIALIVAMVVALMDAVGSAQPTRATRLDVPVIIAMIVVLLGVGVGGFALTAGVDYVADYVTGKESGADHLIKPVAVTGSGLTATVKNVTYTSHFTRVEIAVKNAGQQSVTIPIDGNAAFTGSDGNSLQADGFRSQWTDKIPAGATRQGTITFKGHLPGGTTAAALTLRAGGTAIAVNSIPLSN